MLVTTLREGSVIAALTSCCVVVSGCASTVSTQREVQMGLQASQELEAQLPVLEDALVETYVSDLGQRIVAGLDTAPDVPWRFRVIDSEQVNAFAVPGGFVYVTRGLLEEADTMSELAGPLAHEIAHVVHRHGVEQMTRMQGTELAASLAYVLLGREPGELEQAGLAVGAGAVFASYSRDDEREADASAIEYLERAGIDPAGLTRFFEPLAEGGHRPGIVERWFATHPMTEERIETTRAAIAAKPTGELQVDEPAFEQMQARLRTLPPSPPEAETSSPESGEETPR